ncbi:MAG TPA: hypothetical protein VJ911_07095 [Cryomorphaceae bacterium]|nr:hypothetical protein [Cryomorphaceae bacterium]
MKTVFLSIAAMAMLLVVSCAKDMDQPVTSNQHALSEAKVPEMEYGPQTCDLPDGGCGSQCGNLNSGCWEATDCKANPSSVDNYMSSNYTQAEIDRLARNSTPITDSYILQELKSTGTLPLN